MLSCKTETKEDVYTLCDNQMYLLAPNKDLPTFDFDLNINPKEHIQVLKDSFKLDDLCDLPIIFNNHFNNRKIEVQSIAMCRMYSCSRSTTTIELNADNQMLFELELKNADSIAIIIEKRFPFQFNKSNIIQISSSFGLSKPIINNVIYNISEGYLNALEHISKEKNAKSICDLSQQEIIKLKEDYPIVIELGNIINEILYEKRIQEMINSTYFEEE